MKLSELKPLLAQNTDKNLRFILPTGSKLPPHAHVTEVARIEKRFVDCGGAYRVEFACRLQVWFADDTEHRLTCGKLLSILEKGATLLETENIAVDVECEAPFIAHFPISKLETDGCSMVVSLGITHTACLAPDKCLPPTLNATSAWGISSAPRSRCC